jgi:hypothetical protein
MNEREKKRVNTCLSYCLCEAGVKIFDQADLEAGYYNSPVSFVVVAFIRNL